MNSVAGICNLALAHIGQGRIDSLAEKSPQAEQCGLFYDVCRDALLRSFPWNFATKTVALSQIVGTESGWEYIYQYPGDVLFVRDVISYGETPTDTKNEFEVMYHETTKVICCNVYQAYAKITAKITDPSLFDPQFVEAFSLRLALDLATPLSNSGNKTQEIMAKLQRTLGAAMLSGAIEGTTQKPDDRKTHTSKHYITCRR